MTPGAIMQDLRRDLARRAPEPSLEAALVRLAALSARIVRHGAEVADADDAAAIRVVLDALAARASEGRRDG